MRTSFALSPRRMFPPALATNLHPLERGSRRHTQRQKGRGWSCRGIRDTKKQINWKCSQVWEIRSGSNWPDALYLEPHEFVMRCNFCSSDLRLLLRLSRESIISPPVVAISSLLRDHPTSLFLLRSSPTKVLHGNGAWESLRVLLLKWY